VLRGRRAEEWTSCLQRVQEDDEQRERAADPVEEEEQEEEEEDDDEKAVPASPRPPVPSTAPAPYSPSPSPAADAQRRQADRLAAALSPSTAAALSSSIAAGGRVPYPKPVYHRFSVKPASLVRDAGTARGGDGSDGDDAGSGRKQVARPSSVDEVRACGPRLPCHPGHTHVVAVVPLSVCACKHGYAYVCAEVAGRCRH
jgi:hypothetical protein